ncbi:MAG: type sorting protein [Segetibacter sp.]|nr:type sorting protein [Segetibacter sp.]
MRRILFTLIAFTSTVTAFAQLASKTEKGKEGMYPSYIEFAKGAEPAYSKGGVYITLQSEVKLIKSAILVHSEKQINGLEHPRYQQVYNNIPVEGAIYIMHLVNGKVISENGKWVQDFPTDLTTSPAIGKDAALNAAMLDFGAKSYKWQIQEEEQFIKRESNNASATFYPKAQLVYYSGEEDVIPSNLRLAYKLDLYAANPVARRIYFIDAKTGSVLGKRDLIHNTDAGGTAVTAYSGPQPMTADAYNGSYRLRETGRGNGIQTFNLNKGTSYSAATDFTDADNYWNNVNANLDQYATDAHWGAEMTYDFYKTRFGRNSIDNAGFAIKSYVHYSTNYFNAFWDGSRMTYGDGSSTDNYKPLTALDVCGHEITHGLTAFTANLNYSNESGALNEAFSDIFGTSIEFYGRPSNANWLVGSDFYTIRDMSNPNAKQDPDTYKGTYWYTGFSDNGGVHTNSGVLNYWFYLLSVGGSGTNDNGTQFNVTGVGINNAAAIAYRTLTTYLIPSSQYADARTYSIKAAQDLFGISNPDFVTQTTNAWIAVGVGGSTPPPACSDNYEPNETRSASKSIPVNTNITAKISTTTDKDWFVFTTTSTSPNIKISLSALPKDYDIRLYNSAGTQLRISQNGGTTSELIKYNTTIAGTYYIQVYGYAGANSTACYLLNVSTSGTAFFDAISSESITSIKDVNENKNAFSIYPNPVRDYLNISLTSDSRTNKNVTVFDNTGRAVLRQIIPVQKGPNSIRLNLPKLAKGVYYLKIDQNSLNKLEIIE